MKQIIKELLKRGDFVQSVAEETGKELARQQTEDSRFSEDWSEEFFKTLQETVKKLILEGRFIEALKEIERFRKC